MLRLLSGRCYLIPLQDFYPPIVVSFLSIITPFLSSKRMVAALPSYSSLTITLPLFWVMTFLFEMTIEVDSLDAFVLTSNWNPSGAFSVSTLHLKLTHFIFLMLALCLGLEELSNVIVGIRHSCKDMPPWAYSSLALKKVMPGA